MLYHLSVIVDAQISCSGYMISLVKSHTHETTSHGTTMMERESSWLDVETQEWRLHMILPAMEWRPPWLSVARYDPSA